MKYLVIIKQRGEGCDYTIGCGTCVDTIEAADMDAAIKQATHDVFGEDGMECDERHIESISVIPCVAVVEVDCKTARAEKMKRLADERQCEQEKRERSELARLQRKFGGGQ